MGRPNEDGSDAGDGFTPATVSKISNSMSGSSMDKSIVSALLCSDSRASSLLLDIEYTRSGGNLPRLREP